MAARCWFLLPLEVLLFPFLLLTVSLKVLPGPLVVLDVVAVLALLLWPLPREGPPPDSLPLTNKLLLPLKELPSSRSPSSLRLGPLARLPQLLDALRCALLAVSPGG